LGRPSIYLSNDRMLILLLLNVVNGLSASKLLINLMP
jgi:hypothetical protein